jgi:hypothetical protein
MGGFESATGYNRNREWIDQIGATQHDVYVEEDYARLRTLGIRGVRDAVRWPLVDRKGGYDFATIDPIIEAACEQDMDVIWDLFHYGYPSGLDLFSSEFPERFADYCYATTHYIQRRFGGRRLFFTPVNEPSFYAWAGGEAGLFSPHCIGQGRELKVALVRAAIQGINAIHAVAPDARIINADALCRVVAPLDADDTVLRDVEFFNSQAVFESWDMLAGRLLPELGGSPRHLDIVGLNYYWTNQWQIDQVGTPLDRSDCRCWSLGELIRWAHARTGHPIMISETGHVEENRPEWMLEMADEVESVLRDGLPLLGVCLYPVLGMPEWHEPDVWTNMGLWDLRPDEDGRLQRHPHPATLHAFNQARRVEQIARMATLHMNAV